MWQILPVNCLFWVDFTPRECDLLGKTSDQAIYELIGAHDITLWKTFIYILKFVAYCAG